MFKVVAALLASVLATPLAAHASRVVIKPQLVVRIYNAFGVGPEHMTTAQGTARAILWRAGIDAVWRDCRALAEAELSDSSCDHPLQPGEVLIRVVAAAPTSADGRLGFSWVDVQQRSGSLATVLGDRVEAMAVRTETDLGRLLGRVMAHEIGHMLTGTSQHSPFGLMRARWQDEEVRQDRPGDWMLSQEDARRMLWGFLAQSRRPDKRAMRVAGVVHRAP